MGAAALRKAQALNLDSQLDLLEAFLVSVYPDLAVARFPNEREVRRKWRTARIPSVDPPDFVADSVTAALSAGNVDTRTSRIFGRNLAASWGSRVVVLIVTFLVTPVLARGLGRELYGLWAVGYTLQSYFALTDGGVNGGLLRMVGVANANHDHARVSRYVATAAVFYTVLGFVVLAAVFLVRGVLDHLFGVPPSLETTANFLFVGMALSLVITNLGGVFLAALSGVEDVHTTSFINMFGSLLTSAGFVFALVVLHGSIAGLVVANVLTSVVTTIVAIVACKISIRYLSLSPSLISINHLREIGSLSLFIYVSNMAAVVNSSVDKFMIAGIVSLASAGIYDLGLRLTIMVTTLSYLVARRSLSHGITTRAAIGGCFQSLLHPGRALPTGHGLWAGRFALLAFPLGGAGMAGPGIWTGCAGFSPSGYCRGRFIHHQCRHGSSLEPQADEGGVDLCLVASRDAHRSQRPADLAVWDARGHYGGTLFLDHPIDLAPVGGPSEAGCRSHRLASGSVDRAGGGSRFRDRGHISCHAGCTQPVRSTLRPAGVPGHRHPGHRALPCLLRGRCHATSLLRHGSQGAEAAATSLGRSCTPACRSSQLIHLKARVHGCGSGRSASAVYTETWRTGPNGRIAVLDARPAISTVPALPSGYARCESSLACIRLARSVIGAATQ